MAKERAEHLLILNEACQGLLCRVHWMVRSATPKSLEAKGVEYFLKTAKRGFPKIEKAEAAQVKGYDLFKAAAEQIRGELEDWYLTICDVVAFNEKAIACLTTFVTEISQLNSSNFFLMALFFELLAGYVKLQIAMQSAPEKVRNVTAYLLAFEESQGRKNSSLQIVIDYMQNVMGNQDFKYEDRLWVTVLFLRQSCKPLTAQIRASAKVLWTSIQRWAPAASFERNRMFSILYDASKIVQPAATSKYMEIEYINNFREWLNYALLVCPEALQDQESRSCLNKIISHYFVVPVHRDMIFDMSKTWDKTFWEFKCGHQREGTKFYLKPHRDLVFKEAYMKSNECALNHRFLRRYLQIQLRQYICLFTEIPGLAAPKFQLILALLKLASDEIHWYFQHANSTPFKHKKAEWIPELSQDVNIVKLIKACQDLCGLATRHAGLVKEYFVEYIRDIDAVKLEGEIKKLFHLCGPDMEITFREILMGLLQKARTVSTKENFSQIRLDFFRVITWLSCRQSGLKFHEAQPLLTLLSDMYSHFANVLQTEQQLVKNANIGGIIWYSMEVTKVVKWTLSRRYLFSSSMTLLQFLSHVKFDLNLKFCPDEQNWVIAQTSKYGEYILKQICDAVIKHFGMMQTWVEYNANILGPAVQISKINSIIYKKKGIQDNTPQPGIESKYGGKGYTDLQVQCQNLGRLLGAVRGCKQVQVFKTVFNTHDWLYEALDDHVSGLIQNLFATKDVDTICRPSEALKKLKSLQRTLSFVEQHIALNTSDILRGNVLKHFTNTSAGVIGQDLSLQMKSGSVIQSVGKFYWSLITKDCIGFSPLKMHFYTRLVYGKKPKGEPDAEYYTSHPELKDLCHIVGPYGVKAIQSVVLSNLNNNILEIKRILAENGMFLSQLDFVDDKTWWGNVVKVQEKDEFLTTAIQIGRCLRFISLLKAAQRTVQDSDIPFVSQIVQLVTRRIESDGKIVPGRQLCNVLTDSGVEDPMYDFGVKTIFARIFTSNVTLSHLPKMFACLFLSQIWKTSRFQPDNEGFNTGVEAVITSIQTVIPAVSKNENERISMLKDFVILSAYALLHMNSKVESKDRDMRDYHIPSMMVFMSKFMESCKGLSMHVLEECLPFTLMRTKIIEIYEKIQNASEEK